VGYREFRPPPPLHDLVECAWRADATDESVRILPDGCMDLIAMGDRVAPEILVAGPDTTANVARRRPEPLVGLRFRPGVLPRLLGVPARELRDERIPLDVVRDGPALHGSLVGVATKLAEEATATETAPWSMPLLTKITADLAAGGAVADLAKAIGASNRTLQRQCNAVYGYGPATLRRILRFRRAVRLMRSGDSLSSVSARAGYSDQPHLHREAREFSGLSLTALAAAQVGSAANRSTDVPSGSLTVA
jgi:AraC-like DNA-binding protein